MSEMEFHRGKLRKLENNFMSLEDMAWVLCVKHGVHELEPYHDDWIDQFKDTFYRGDYVLIRDEIYELVDHEEFNPDNIEILKNTEDGEIEFIISFYNGGASFDEALSELFSKKTPE